MMSDAFNLFFFSQYLQHCNGKDLSLACRQKASEQLSSMIFESSSSQLYLGHREEVSL